MLVQEEVTCITCLDVYWKKSSHMMIIIVISFLHALNIAKKPKQCQYAFYLNMFTAGRYNVELYK